MKMQKKRDKLSFYFSRQVNEIQFKCRKTLIFILFFKLLYMYKILPSNVFNIHLILND